MNYFFSFQLISVSLLSWTNQHFSVPNLQVLLLLFLQRDTRWICSCFLWFNNSELNLKSFPHDLHSKFAVSRSFLDFIWLNQQFWSPKSQVPFANLQQIDTLSVCMFFLCFIKSFLLRKVSSQKLQYSHYPQYSQTVLPDDISCGLSYQVLCQTTYYKCHSKNLCQKYFHQINHVTAPYASSVPLHMLQHKCINCSWSWFHLKRFATL